MDIAQMLDDVKQHLEQGAELAASHVPALVEWAAGVQADPLVQAAIGLQVPDASKTLLAGFLKDYAAQAAQIAADAEAKAHADAEAAAQQAAAAPAVPEVPADGAETPAEATADATPDAAVVQPDAVPVTDS